jgi:hypothetical protein
MNKPNLVFRLIAVATLLVEVFSPIVSAISPTQASCLPRISISRNLPSSPIALFEGRAVFAQDRTPTLRPYSLRA